MNLIKINFKIIFVLISVLLISTISIAKNLSSFSDTVQHYKDKRVSDSLEKIKLIEELEAITNKPSLGLIFDDIVKLASDDETFIVSANILNLRDKPNGQKIETLKEGDVVINLESQGKWFKVISIDNKIGWVSSEFLRILDQKDRYIVEKKSNKTYKNFYYSFEELYLEKQISFESHFGKIHSDFLFDKKKYPIDINKGLKIIGLAQFLISGYDGLNISNICTENIADNEYEKGYWCEDIKNSFLNSEINQICGQFDSFFQRNTNKILLMGCYFDNINKDEVAIAELLDIYMKQKYGDAELYILHYDKRDLINQKIYKYHYDQYIVYSWFFDENKRLEFYSFCEDENCGKPKLAIETGDFTSLFNSTSEYVEFEKKNIKAILPKFHFSQNKTLYDDLGFMKENFLQTKINDVDESDGLTNNSNKVTISEIDLLRNQLHSCVSLPIGYSEEILRDIKPIIINIEVKPDRSVKSAEIINKEEFVDPTYRLFAESALRAINNPDCNPLLLPPNKYESWKEIKFTFDFSWMYN